MHKVIPRTTPISPTIGESEIPGSEANQPHLKFVVKYREAAKRKQKVFEKEEEAIQFARTKILIFDVIPSKTQRLKHLRVCC